jgi:hypothetical protein
MTPYIVSQLEKPFFLSILLEPTSDLRFPDLYSLMVLGIMLFQMFQKPLYDLASRRKDAQADQDKQDALQNGEEQANNPQNDE